MKSDCSCSSCVPISEPTSTKPSCSHFATLKPLITAGKVRLCRLFSTSVLDRTCLRFWFESTHTVRVLIAERQVFANLSATALLPQN